MSTTLKLAFLLMSVAPWLAAKSDPGMEELLSKRYHEQILALRHSFTAASQRYDVDGRILAAGEEGPWTLYGRVIVDRIAVKPDELRVLGHRATFMLDDKKKILVPVPDPSQVSVSIRLQRPLDSEADADAVLAHVFAMTQRDLVDSAPLSWRDYLRVHAAETAELKTEAPAESTVVKAEEDLVDGEKVIRLGAPGILAPKPQFMPEPQFSEFARRAHYQGTLVLQIVVDTSGKVARVQILKPLGFGLDEEATGTVKTWRFAPATMNGEAVPALFTVEVSFNLYGRPPNR